GVLGGAGGVCGRPTSAVVQVPTQRSPPAWAMSDGSIADRHSAIAAAAAASVVTRLHAERSVAIRPTPFAPRLCARRGRRQNARDHLSPRPTSRPALPAHLPYPPYLP